MHGLDPRAVDAERLQIVELRRQADEVGGAVGERLEMQLIEDRVFYQGRSAGLDVGIRLRPKAFAVGR